MAERVRSVGPLLPDPSPAPRPSRITLQGRTVMLEPLNESHADELYPLVGGSEHAWLWDYMPDGPFTSIEQFRVSVTAKAQMEDPLFWAVIVPEKISGDNKNHNKNHVGGKGKAVGIVSLLRISPENRTVEVGAILFSPALQRTTAATEVIYLLGKHVFRDLGYRRFEWKCNSLNESSKRAALRLGFSYEGLFRQHMIVKGRNRDTAWYAMLDSEWEGIQAAFEKWLEPSNFDGDGAQQKRLEEFRVAQ
jgi:RimJ/RimL family protein N-acetyltransferase